MGGWTGPALPMAARRRSSEGAILDLQRIVVTNTEQGGVGVPAVLGPGCAVALAQPDVFGGQKSAWAVALRTDRQKSPVAVTKLARESSLPDAQQTGREHGAAAEDLPRRATAADLEGRARSVNLPPSATPGSWAAR